MFDPEYKLPELPRIESGYLSLDFETKDKNIKEHGPGWVWQDRDHYVLGAAVAWEGGEAYYNFAHPFSEKMDIVNFWLWLADCLKRPEVQLVVANASYELGWLWRNGVRQIAGRVCDVQLAAPLCDDSRKSYSLNNLGRDYIGERKDEYLLEQAALQIGVHPSHIKGHLWRLSAGYVAQYAAQDAGMTLRLWKVLDRKMTDEGLQKAYDLEQRVAKMLIPMRARGVRIDVEAAEQAAPLVKQNLHKWEEKLYTYKVEGWAASTIAAAFDSLGIKYPLTEGGLPSFTKSWLTERVKQGCGLSEALLEYRRWDKIDGTFLEKYVLGHLHGGRVHACFNQLKSDEGGAVTGRFSSSNPNLQNLPSPDKDAEMARYVRNFFLPEENEVWFAADYKQQEPRWMVEYASRAKFESGIEAANTFKTKSDIDFHDYVTHLISGLELSACKTSPLRKKYKPISLGVPYGMGPGKLCASLGYPTVPASFEKNGKKINYAAAGPEGAAILEQYHAKFPFMKELMDLTKRQANNNGFLILVDGRRARFPRNAEGEREHTHKALNRLIQGSSAVQTKTAMVNIYEDLDITALVTIHDELAFSVDPKDRDTKRKIIQHMKEALPTTVPFHVDVEEGRSWGECTKSEETDE